MPNLDWITSSWDYSKHITANISDKPKLFMKIVLYKDLMYLESRPSNKYGFIALASADDTDEVYLYIEDIENKLNLDEIKLHAESLAICWVDELQRKFIEFTKQFT